MLAADTTLEVWSLRTATLDTILYELADTLSIDGLERISVQNLVAEILTHECSNVITREAESHLSKVIGTEREELCGTGHSVTGEGGTRNLDHGTELVVDRSAVHTLNLSLNSVADSLLETELTS